MNRFLATAAALLLAGCATTSNNQRDIAILSALYGAVDAVANADIGEWTYVQDYSTTTRFQFAIVESKLYTMMMMCIVVDASEQTAVVMLYGDQTSEPDKPLLITWLFDGQQPLEMIMDIGPGGTDGEWSLQTYAEPMGAQFHNRAAHAKKTITAKGLPPLAGAGTINVEFLVDTEIASKSNCQ